jgi:hypothetical protein
MPRRRVLILFLMLIAAWAFSLGLGWMLTIGLAQIGLL